ncbi:MAG: thioredoxin family protein [Kurthia sp.]|nr:thioredoxin family protein [Candidatus Kurthia equi]
MKILQSVEQFNELKEGSRTVFVFSAGWCPDCRFIEPFMPVIEAKYHNYQFILVDRDQFIDLCVELDVFGIPSFIMYENGQEVNRFVSKDRKTQQEIEEFLEAK